MALLHRLADRTMIPRFSWGASRRVQSSLNTGIGMPPAQLLARTTLLLRSGAYERMQQEITDGARFGLSVGYRVRTWSAMRTAERRRLGMLGLPSALVNLDIARPRCARSAFRKRAL